MTDLRELMERAVTTAPPETLVPHDVLDAARHDLRRRQAWMSVVTAAAVAVVLGVGWGLLSLRADREAPVLDDPVDATPGALAAVAVEHLGAQPTELHGLSASDQYPDGAFAATLTVPDAQRGGQGMLTLVASPTAIPHARDCDRLDGCAEVETRAGTVGLGWFEDGLGGQGVVVAVMRHGDEMSMVVWTGAGVSGDPRDDDLAVPVSEMLRIISDPRFGMQTSTDMVDRGSELIAE